MVELNKPEDANKAAAPAGDDVRPEDAHLKQHSGLAKSLGSYAFEHRDHLNSGAGKLIWRNIVKGTFAWVPTVVAFTGNRYLFTALRDEQKLGKYLSKDISKILEIKKPEQILGRGIENTSFVVAGFTTYRSFIKFWQRAYDRIAGAKTKEEAVAAVENIPGNILKDAPDIIPKEFSSTMLAAPVLAMVRLGLNPAPAAIAGEKFAERVATANKGYLHDTVAATLAYSAFFEVNDRAYANMSGGKDAVDKMYDPHKPKPEGPKKHYRFFSEDGVGRMAFRRIASVGMGFIPYIAIQRYSRSKVGDVQPFAKDVGLMKNLGREYSNHVAFSVYTAGSEVYGKAYDDLFNKLEEKHNSQSRN